MVERDHGGSARIEQQSDLAVGVKVDHVVREIDTIVRHSLPPTWEQLQLAVADERPISKEQARSWINSALSSGRIMETADERLARTGVGADPRR